MWTSSSFQRTRIAPTPSGYLHLGNLFSFALTAALAEKTGASVFLRIDDQDAQRVSTAYLDDIFETLGAMDIPWQEGPRDRKEFEARYSQRYRMALYEKALLELREKGLVYACSCSRSQIQAAGEAGYPGTCRHKNLSLDADNVSWRLKTDRDQRVVLNSYGQGAIETTLPVEMRDMVLRRRDGLPAYQLSSVVDDAHYGVDFIVRGMDLWPSSVFQVYLAGLLGAESFQKVVFYHHVLLVDEQGGKLSKSAGAGSVQNLRTKGLTQREIFNEVASKAGKAGCFHWRDFQVFL